MEVVELMESELLCSLPWVTSDNFVSCVHEGRILLEVTDRRGDPTGVFEFELLCGLPWVTSDNFVSCVHEGR